MSDFDDLIRASLQTANAGFQQADTDLNDVVRQVSESISRVSGGKVSLRLVVLSDKPEQRIYQAQVVSGKQAAEVEGSNFAVTTNGYPILVGIPTVDFASQNFDVSAMQPLNDKAAIEAHFRSQLATPDSPLVFKVAFFSRNQKK